MSSPAAASRITEIFLRGMLAVVWLIWAPVGFFFWIPLLLRVTLTFAGMTIHAVVTGQNPRELRSHLEAAIDFWFAGFRMARLSVLCPDVSPVTPVRSQAHLLAIEILWASAVWIFGTWLVAPSVLHDLYDLVNNAVKGSREAWIFLALLLAGTFLVIGMLVERIRASAKRESPTVPEQPGR
jgi:hypothetical protein